MNRDLIINILFDEFDSVYCPTCKYKPDESGCDECHRKNMNWGLSEEAAAEIADKILDKLSIKIQEIK